MNLSDLLNEATICCPLVSNSRNGAIQELLNHLQSLGHLSSTIKLYQYIEELENNHSTAAGKGVAYPHSTSIEVDSLICVLGISKIGLDFNSTTFYFLDLLRKQKINTKNLANPCILLKAIKNETTNTPNPFNVRLNWEYKNTKRAFKPTYSKNSESF